MQNIKMAQNFTNIALTNVPNTELNVLIWSRSKLHHSEYRNMATRNVRQIIFQRQQQLQTFSIYQTFTCC